MKISLNYTAKRCSSVSLAHTHTHTQRKTPMYTTKYSVFVEVLMSPSSSGLIPPPPLLIWHASLGLGPFRSAGLKSASRDLMNLPCIHKQRTNKTGKKHLLPWIFNCQSITAFCLSIVSFFFSPLTKELLTALGNRSLLRFLGISDACWVTSSARRVSFHFTQAVWEHLYVFLRGWL